MGSLFRGAYFRNFVKIICSKLLLLCHLDISSNNKLSVVSDANIWAFSYFYLSFTQHSVQFIRFFLSQNGGLLLDTASLFASQVQCWVVTWQHIVQNWGMPSNVTHIKKRLGLLLGHINQPLGFPSHKVFGGLIGLIG